MIARIFLSIIVAAMIYVLLRALITGVLLIDESGRIKPIVRDEDPAGFWTMIIFVVLTIAYFVWAILL